MSKYPTSPRPWFASVLGPLALILFIITFLVALTRLDASDSSSAVVETQSAVPAELLTEKLNQELPELQRRLQQHQQIERVRIEIAPVVPRQ